VPGDPEESELPSAPAFEQMVDTRLEDLEARLTRIEEVLLDLKDQSRTCNRTSKGRRSLQHFCRRTRSALRRRTDDVLWIIYRWLQKQALRCGLCCFVVAAGIYRIGGDTLEADRAEKLAMEVREQLRLLPPDYLYT
jgi:hypothetical protein